MFKKIIKSILVLSVVAVSGITLTGCGGGSEQITVITREDGSGTRGAFVEIVDIRIDDNDATCDEAVVQPGTGAVLTAVAADPFAIGYVSAGRALSDDRVSVISVGGFAPTVENMLSGAYAIARPFLIGYGTADGLSDLAQDFVDFILSEQGQAIVAREGYVPYVQNAPQYTPSGLTGVIVVNGSSSAYSLMQHLSEAYREINPDVRIDVHGAGTGHGITAVRDGLADIAMSSRDFRESELEFMTPLTMGIDGIAVIVNLDNPVSDLSLAQIRSIFTGEIKEWDDIR